MDLDPLPLATAFGLLVALIGMWRSERALSRSKGNELGLLRQSVILKAEAARSEWYKLNRENDTVIHRLEVNRDLPPELRAILSAVLKDWKEFLGMSIADASAFAEDALTNSANFNEKDCKERLTAIEVSIEKLKRNQGESERRYNQLVERVAAHNATTSGMSDR